MSKKYLARQDMRKYLDQLDEAISKPLSLKENFLMNGEGPTRPSVPDLPGPEDGPVPGQEGPSPEEVTPQDKGSEEATLMGVKDEINQIRTIALKTIARLSDYPNSEGYDMMKKIWNMCDKAMAPAKEDNSNGGGPTEQ